MLKLVRDRGSLDPDLPPAWSETSRDDDRSDRPPTRPPNDRYWGDSPYRRRRSVAARVSLTITIAAALMFAGVVAYVAARNGALDAVLAHQEAQPPAPQTVSQPAPESRPAPPQVVRPPIPDVQGLVILIRNAVVALHQANTTGNYSVLREIAAPGFQQANSPASLSEAFAGLRNRGVDLSQITVVNPRLRSEPAINQQSLLRLVGFFPVGSEQVDFDLVFQMVGDRWRLFGIGLYPPKTTNPAPGEAATAKPPAPDAIAQPAMPSPATMVALIRGAAIALNQANMTGDYSVLRDISAPGFQEANSLAKLATIFASLRARQLDLGPVAVIDPRLFRPAAIDKQGYLRLAGYFPSKPEQVNFDLAFQFGAGQWRLFGIGLNTSREVPATPDAAIQKSAGEAPVDDEPIAGPAGTSGDTLAPPEPRLRPKP